MRQPMQRRLRHSLVFAIEQRCSFRRPEPIPGWRYAVERTRRDLLGPTPPRMATPAHRARAPACAFHGRAGPRRRDPHRRPARAPRGSDRRRATRLLGAYVLTASAKDTAGKTAKATTNLTLPKARKK